MLTKMLVAIAVLLFLNLWARRHKSRVGLQPRLYAKVMVLKDEILVDIDPDVLRQMRAMYGNTPGLNVGKTLYQVTNPVRFTRGPYATP